MPEFAILFVELGVVLFGDMSAGKVLDFSQGMVMALPESSQFLTQLNVLDFELDELFQN